MEKREKVCIMFLVTSLPETKDLSTLVTTPVSWDNLNLHPYLLLQVYTIDTKNEIKDVHTHTYI